jgi:hypothetical protein
VIAALTTVLFAWAAVRENAGKKGLTKKQWHLFSSDLIKDNVASISKRKRES